PDGMLYLSLGDDGNACAAQDTVALGGVVLRLDVSHLPDGPGGPPDPAQLVPADNPFASSPDPGERLVWVLGLKNPFRFHIDRNDGALYVADVGELQSQEIDRADAGGRDFGWPFFEGPFTHVADCLPDTSATYGPPIYAYSERSSGDQ